VYELKAQHKTAETHHSELYHGMVLMELLIAHTCKGHIPNSWTDVNAAVTYWSNTRGCQQTRGAPPDANTGFFPMTANFRQLDNMQ
jgi:hypothetical protein